jgi:hypothetical protein
MFDLNNYERVKSEVIKQIKDKLSHWQTEQGFIADGLFNPKEYSKQKLKILFILGEYYDHEKDGMINIESQIKKEDEHYDFLGLRNPKYPDVKTTKTIPGLLYYLYGHYDPNIKKNIDGYVEKNLDLNKTKKLDNIFNQAQEFYCKCGMIDIKKDSTSFENNKMKRNKIKESINKYADIIKKQIEAMSTNLIIVGGKDILWGLQKEGLLPFEINEYPTKDKPPIVREFDGIYYVFAIHPQFWWENDVKYIIDLFDNPRIWYKF